MAKIFGSFFTMDQSYIIYFEMLNKSLLRDLVILIIAATAIIFFRYNEIPQKLAYDEVELAKVALSLDGSAYTPYSELADGHGTVYFYVMLMSFKLFGIDSWAMRLPAALSGLISIIAFYFMVKIAFKKTTFPYSTWLPLIASLTLLSQRWFYNFARFAFETPFLLLLELISVLLFFIFQEKYRSLSFSKSAKWAILFFSAIFAGLAFNSYQPGRIFFLLPMFFLLARRHIKELIVYGVVVFLVSLPMTASILGSQTVDPRFDQQFFLKNTDLSYVEKVDFLKTNLTKTVGMLFVSGDLSGRHNYPGKPAVTPIIGVFLVIGLIAMLRDRSIFYNQFFLVWMIVAVIPSILTYPWENPNMLRTFTLLPSIAYTVAYGVGAITDLVKKSYQKLMFAGIIAVLLISVAWDLRTYYVYQVPVFENSFERENDLQKNIKVDKELESRTGN